LAKILLGSIAKTNKKVRHPRRDDGAENLMVFALLSGTYISREKMASPVGLISRAI